MSKYRVILTNPSIDGITGHHTVEATLEDVSEGDQTVTGIMEKYGISGAELDSKYSGDIKKWAVYIGQDLKLKHERRMTAHHELLDVHGQVFEIE